MTPIRPSPPERGTEPLAMQLDLFPDPTSVTHADERGICRAVARDAIGPGWWQLVAPHYNPLLDVVVEECHERDGELIIRLTYGDGTPYDEMAERIRESAKRTCGACGAGQLHHVMVGRDATGNLAGFSKLILSSLLGLTGTGPFSSKTRARGRANTPW